jgi:hypothetical protein
LALKKRFLISRKGSRQCPLANSRFRHQPDPIHPPESKLEAAYYKADTAIQDIVNLLAAA